MVTTDDEEEHPQSRWAPPQRLRGLRGQTFPVEPSFGAEFFSTMLHGRVRKRCAERTVDVPVVELQLADGTTLDLCHIPTVERLWLSVEANRDTSMCEEMDLVFVPYETVTRVTIMMLPASRRPIVFHVPRQV